MSFQPGKHRAESYPEHLDLEADAVVVGSGAGGSAAACALAEAGARVIVLEEGRHWTPGEFVPKSTWAFRNLYAGRGTRASRGNALVPIPGGRGVGGSTLINSAISFRTPSSVLKAWRDEHGCDRFTDAHMGALFDRIFATIGVGVNPEQFQRTNNQVFKRGAEALGLAGAWMPRAAPGCVGCGTCQQGCNSGGKNSIDRTFLAEALATGNVAVYSGCRVEEVPLAGRRVAEIRASWLDPRTDEPAGTVVVRAPKVVISAGPIGTPRLLLRNGLSAGPVGEGLKIHPTCGVVGRFEEEVRPWTGVSQGYYVDCFDRGFLLQTFNMPPDQVYTGMQVPNEVALELLADLRHLAFAGVVAHDEDSTGRVGEGSLEYWLGERDRRVLLDGMRQAARVFFAAGAKAAIPGARGLSPIERVEDVDAVITDDIAAWQIGLYAAHPMGTCRMGPEPRTAVVDPAGKVHGIENAWIADASVFPTSLGVNPQVTVMAVGLTVGAEAARA